MMDVFVALLKKEGRIILRSRLLLLVLVLYPLVIVGIIGYAFSSPNQRVPVAIVNQDIDPKTGLPDVGEIQSPVEGNTATFRVSTTDIIRGLRDFATIREVDAEEGRRLLLTGEVQAVIRFPPRFIDNVVNFRTSGEVNITLDMSDPVRAKYMEVIINGVVNDFQTKVIKRKVELVVNAIEQSLDVTLPPSDPLYPSFVGVRNRLQEIYNTHADLSSADRTKLNESMLFLDTVIDFLENSRDIVGSLAQPVQVGIQHEESGSLFIRDLVVPAALGLSIFWTGSLATSSLVVYERESPAYTRLRITSATPLSIYGSKIAVTVAIILAQALFILLAAVLAWDTRIDNPLLTFIVILFSTFASMGIGLFISGLSKDVNGTILLSVLVTFPMLFLAGLFYPVEFMPAGAQLLARGFPLTYTVSGLRGSMLRGFDFADALPQLTMLLLMGGALTALGVFLGRRLELRR